MIKNPTWCNRVSDFINCPKCKEKMDINGKIYAYVKNDILNRFVFLFPNENAKTAFRKEIEEISNNIMELKKTW